MAYVHFLPTFLNHGSPKETLMVNELSADLNEYADSLGAEYVYVCKNKTGAYRPLTFAFYAHGGKFLARRTPNTLVEATA